MALVNLSFVTYNRWQSTGFVLPWNAQFNYCLLLLPFIIVIIAVVVVVIEE